MSSRWKWPDYFYFDNFRRAMKNSNMLAAYKNTLIITAFAIVLIVIIGSFAAYPLARRQTRVNKNILRFVMGIMVIPPLSILVPLYSLMVNLGGISTHWGIVCLLSTFNLPLSIFLFSNFIKAIPVSLDEAAQIDGCGPGRCFFFIILPQLKQVVVSVAILTGVGCWNDYGFALYMLQSPRSKTVTLTVASFFSQGSSDLNAAAAVALFGILPVVVFFVFLQKYFVKGMVDSAIK
jgi:raffinose/stachyose/melibiose transport system permease protein